MAVQVSFPGVYIEEFTPGAPIAGVGTSTAAFVGPAADGPLNEPTKVTSWDAFRATFGEEPLPGFYLWHAVRGFFMNGGQVCYVVRASNGRYASVALRNRATPALVLATARARQGGERAAHHRCVPGDQHLYGGWASVGEAGQPGRGGQVPPGRLGEPGRA